MAPPRRFATALSALIGCWVVVHCNASGHRSTPPWRSFGVTRRLPRWFKLVIALRVCVAMAAICFTRVWASGAPLFGIAWIFVAIVVAVMIRGTVSGSKGAREDQSGIPFKQAKHSVHGRSAKLQGKAFNGKRAANASGFGWTIPLASTLAIVACAFVPGEVGLCVIAGFFWVACGCALCSVMINSLFPDTTRRGGRDGGSDRWSN